LKQQKKKVIILSNTDYLTYP